MSNHSEISFAFFGTSEFAVLILAELKSAGFLPRLVVTAPDKPQGRKLIITSPPTKIWAKENNLPVWQPQTLRELDALTYLQNFPTDHGFRAFDIFIVAAYGLIIPANIIDIPRHDTINVHPSLLPRWRGASPIQGALLNDDETGISIMKIDAELDHGPVIYQEKVATPVWPLPFSELHDFLAKQSGKLLASNLPLWLKHGFGTKEQDHTQATYTKKIKKEDGLIDLSDDALINYRKFCAYTPWPSVYFFERGKRVIIKDATLENGIFVPKQVLPEGSKVIDWGDYRQSRSV